MMMRAVFVNRSLGLPRVAACYSPNDFKRWGDSTISTNPYTLESGQARKGTFAATVNNIFRLNQLAQAAHTQENEDEIQAIVAAIDQLIPSLNYVAMFDLFEPAQWLGNGDQIGRIVVLALFFNHYPQKDTAHLKEKIASMASHLHFPS